MGAFPTSFRARLAALVAGALAVRVLYTILAGQDAEGIGDLHYYHAIAGLLADGRGFIDPFLSTATEPYPSALHPPLWPLLLGLSSKLGAGSELAHRLVGCLAGTGAVLVIGVLARRVGGDRVGLLAALIAAIYPTLIAADGSLMSESLYGLVVGLVLLVALRLRERPTSGWAAAVGALIGLAALTRGEALLLVPVLALPLAWRGARAGRAGRLAATLAATALVLAPWTVRNWIELDRPVPISTNDSTVVAGANCDETYRGQDIGYWRLDCISERRPGLNEAEQAVIWREEGRTYLREHAERLPVVVPVRILRTWDLYQPRRMVLFAEGRNRRMTQAGVAVFYLLAAAAVFGAVVLHRRRGPMLVVLSPVIVVTLSSAAGFGLPRFRHAAEITIVVLAAVALDSLLARRTQTRLAPAEQPSRVAREA